MNLKGRDFLTLKQFTAEELRYLLDFAHEVKRRTKAGESFTPMRGKVMAMIFQKPSLRTRVSFEVGMFQMGGTALYLAPSDIGLGSREPVRDVAKVLSRQVDVIMARVFGHEIVEALAEYASVPVINGLSDYVHPCQALADFQTIEERGKTLSRLKLAFIGDGNNVARSLVFGGVRLGVQVWVASPPGYQLEPAVQLWAEEEGKRSGGSLTLTDSVEEAAKNADVLYTDVWASMGQEKEVQARREAFRGYQINREILNLAKPDAVVLHCLPAHYGEEITEDVADSPQSAIYDEAENRLHAQKALVALLAGEL
ncbi:MAG TPA: ornithine carbamoyltransferase [Acidobacteriota bacterium]|nr:ornithine carbamoyltransferase [Acidobacteriota bacterium]